jgi:hypothetical protein
MDMAWDMDIKAVFRIRIHVFLGLPDPDPALEPDPDIFIIKLFCDIFLTFYL